MFNFYEQGTHCRCVDASDSDRRFMTSLLIKAGYQPISVETLEAAKYEVAKLPPDAVIISQAR